MRPILFCILIVLAGCKLPEKEMNDSKTIAVSQERRAELESESFETCQLRNPEETWIFWDNVLKDEDKETVKSASYDSLIQFHHGWGTGIRNSFCLWKGGPLQTWFNEHQVSHPDSMSQVLIELYWAHLNGCNPQVSEFARSDPGDTDLLNCPNDLVSTQQDPSNEDEEERED